jgi:hypothetical protein
MFSNGNNDFRMLLCNDGAYICTIAGMLNVDLSLSGISKAENNGVNRFKRGCAPMNGIENRNEIGIKALIRKGRKKFRIDENLRYYEPDHLKVAEKKFIKECILNGKCE